MHVSFKTSPNPYKSSILDKWVERELIKNLDIIFEIEEKAFRIVDP